MKKYLSPTVLCFFLFITIYTLSTELVFCQENKKIEIIQSDFLRYDKKINPDLRRLIGNVILRHNFTLMYCDSAYFYQLENKFQAYGEIKVKQADSLYLTCDSLKYSGNTNIAKARQNVVLVNKDITLFTDNLDYNTNTSSGHYFHKGKIINKETTLKSEQGNYFSQTNFFHFKDSVIITNPKYKVNSDTIHYHTKNEIIYFLGPSIISSEDNYVYCEYGFHNTKDSISQFETNAFVKGQESIIYGDLLYYNEKESIGQGRKNVTIYDFTKDIIIKGDKIDFNTTTEDFISTDSALAIMINEGDSLFIHSDTIKSYIEIIDDIYTYDSTGTIIIDTIKGAKNRLLQAYNKVKLFRNDIQAKCDSMTFNTSDSIIKLYKEPVLWSGENQMTSNYVEIILKNQKFDRILLQTDAFIASKEDSSKYNQIKGKKMIGYFRNNQIELIDVDGNGQMVYFIKENENYVGMNKVESSNLKLHITNRKIKKVNSITKPVANLTPIEQLVQEDMKLKGFNWYEHYRPISKLDIFRWE